MLASRWLSVTWRDQRGSSGAGILSRLGSMPQISRAYWAMVRSLENFPQEATFWITLRVHCLVSCAKVKREGSPGRHLGITWVTRRCCLGITCAASTGCHFGVTWVSPQCHPSMPRVVPWSCHLGVTTWAYSVVPGHCEVLTL